MICGDYSTLYDSVTKTIDTGITGLVKDTNVFVCTTYMLGTGASDASFAPMVEWSISGSKVTINYYARNSMVRSIEVNGVYCSFILKANF